MGFLVLGWVVICTLTQAWGMSEGQKKLFARQAAIKDAQRQLSEIIYGVTIDSNTTVKDFF